MIQERQKRYIIVGGIHVLISVEEHDGTRIVQFVHFIKIRCFCDIDLGLASERLTLAGYRKNKKPSHTK